MQTHPFVAELVAHSEHPPTNVSRIEARIIGLDDNWLRLRWRVEGSEALILPPFSGRGRADELWKTTCFEMFLRKPDTAAYVELNLSPSERWAAYEFTSYREDMADWDMPREPDCTIRQGTAFTIFDAAVPRSGLFDLPWSFGLSAVIEEEGGVKSYWALAHADGPPDFHHPACFAARLDPPQAA